MFCVNSDKQLENEENTLIVNILGKIDCPKVTLCKNIADNILKKTKFLIRINFHIEFETQFDVLREKLLQEDIDFLPFEHSPILYSQQVKFYV